MPGLIRPPYGAPTGPLIDSEDLVRSFVGGARTGHSLDFHIEDEALLIERFVPIAIRLGDGCLLLRMDTDTGDLEAMVAQLGLQLIEKDPPLATVIALQSLGLPAATWDLWSQPNLDTTELVQQAAYNEQVG